MPEPFTCPSTDGPGPCQNNVRHDAPKGCVHHSTNGSWWVPDHHDKPGRGDNE